MGAKKLLFIGDSITDCGRREDEQQLGSGYVRIIHDELAVRDPAHLPTILNRGISGNKIGDLQKRWQRDVIDLKPDLLSVFIGINDVWHGMVPGRTGTSIDAFIEGYRDILQRAFTASSKLKLVLCEPSVLWLDEADVGNDELKPYVKAVHQLAEEFKAIAVVPLHGTFNRARQANPDIAWTTDGVHPTSTGHMLIARAWLNSVKF